MKKIIALVMFFVMLISTASTAFASSNDMPERTEISVTDVGVNLQKIEEIIEISKNEISFNKVKAASLGFSSLQISNLAKTYEEINQEIRNGNFEVEYNQYGVIDIKRVSNENVFTNKVSEFEISPDAQVTKHWYGLDIYLSVRECADLAAMLAGGAAGTGAVAGVLGLTGFVPAAIAATIAAGVIGMGSAYFWYCSNANGLDISVNYIFAAINPLATFSFSRRD